MNKTIWKQYDSRWGSKPYPTKRYNVSNCGCGLVACTHIAMEQEAKANWTPNKLRAWMVKQGFAIAGQGTTWSGIPKTLKHIGHDSVVWVTASDPMSKAWAELRKGARIGIILFYSGTAPDGTVWTSSGHYVAFTGYKIKNGKHYFYTKDSGGRNNSGWHTYEDSMKGCVGQMFITRRVKTPQERAVTWSRKIADNDKYKYKKYTTSANSHKCPICHPGTGNGWNCIGFAFACWHHGMGIKSKCSCNVFNNSEYDKIRTMSNKKALAFAKENIGIDDVKVIRNSGKKIPLSKLKKGDICVLYNGSTYYHTIFYIGNGKYADATSSAGIKCGKKLSKTFKKHIKIAFRYTGK